jgi:hypothetical protein
MRIDVWWWWWWSWCAHATVPTYIYVYLFAHLSVHIADRSTGTSVYKCTCRYVAQLYLPGQKHTHKHRSIAAQKRPCEYSLLCMYIYIYLSIPIYISHTCTCSFILERMLMVTRRPCDGTSHGFFLNRIDSRTVRDLNLIIVSSHIFSVSLKLNYQFPSRLELQVIPWRLR